MPQIMAEAFARGLLDKIMIEVLDVIDCDAENGKSWEQHVNEETGDVQSEYVHDRSQANERTHINYNKAEEIELIAKIVRDLRDIRIGDSRYVLPPSLLALEKQAVPGEPYGRNCKTHTRGLACATRSRFTLVPHLSINSTHDYFICVCSDKQVYSRDTRLSSLEQVKCAACNDDAPLTNSTVDVIETQYTTRGQGDMHQIVQAAIFESTTELMKPVKTIRKTKEGEAANEATNVSIGLLQQLVEDLQNKTVSVCSEDDTSLHSISKEHIAVYQDKEEEFSRTIEDDADDTHETLQSSESIGRFHVIELKREEELRSHSSQYVASTSREISLEEVQIEKRGSNSLSSLKALRDDGIATVDKILSINDAEKRKTFNEVTTRKKKRGFGSRLRKLFRAAFGRRKN